jgi:hypothetical protein
MVTVDGSNVPSRTGSSKISLSVPLSTLRSNARRTDGIISAANVVAKNAAAADTGWIETLLISRTAPSASETKLVDRRVNRLSSSFTAFRALSERSTLNVDRKAGAPAATWKSSSCNWKDEPVLLPLLWSAMPVTVTLVVSTA